MSQQVTTANNESQTFVIPTTLEFVDLSEDMLEKRLQAMKSRRLSKSNADNTRKTSEISEENYMLRENGTTKVKGLYSLSMGTQCDLKLAHPHFRQLQTQVNKLKVDLEKKSKIVSRQTETYQSQIDELKKELKHQEEVKQLIAKQTQSTFEMLQKERESQAAQKLSK